jgi:hypothetical protein
VFSCVFVGGCANNHKEPEIKAGFEVKVQDPDIRRLTNVTSNIEVVASGVFKPGTFILKNSLISIPPDTQFNISLSLPIDNPAVISTENASGELWTSNQLSFNAVPVPKSIELKGGTVSGHVDLARSVGAFFLNIIQVGALSGDMRDMIHSMKIEEVELKLRPDSTIKLGEKSIHVGADSSVRLTNALIDKDLNYVGKVHLNLNFISGCKWIGEKVDCQFNGGKMQSVFEAKKTNDKLVLSLPEKPTAENKPVVLHNCDFRFGKNKRSDTSSDTVIGAVKEFTWQHVKGEEHPTLHLVSALEFTGSDLNLKTDIHQTTGHFPQTVPGVLEVNVKKEGRETIFRTTGSAQAKSGQILIAKDATKLILSLADVTIGRVAYEKEGSLQFQLDGGIAHLRKLDWEASDSQFTLDCDAGSTMTVPAEMFLAKNNPSGPTELKLPLKLKLGKATLKTKRGNLDLANLSGDIIIEVNKQIHLKSDLGFKLQDVKLLSGYAAGVSAQGLDVAVKDGKISMSVKKCSIMVPDEPLKEAIRSRIPNRFEKTLNKTIKEDKTWRYKHAVAKDVKVTNLRIDEMRSAGPGKLGFTASGDVVLNGTVEKAGIIFNKDEFETCPWSLTGHVKGDGTVKYSFKDKTKDKDEHLKYELSMQLPIPDDVKLDWSKVAGGIIKMAERKVILGRLKQITLPLNTEGEINVIEKETPAWRNLKVTALTVKDAPDGGTQIDFVAETRTD